MNRIDRHGECPQFLEYVTRKCLLPYKDYSNESEEFKNATQYGVISDWVEVPSYQRGIVWKPDLLEELLGSSSLLLGNAVLARFSIPQQKGPQFQNLPNGVSHYSILIDGLQRFSIGTALLNIVYKHVISETAEHAAMCPQFSALAQQVQGKVGIFQYNHFQLCNHPRTVISDSYQVFYNKLDSWFRGELHTGVQQKDSLIEDVQRLFLNRQIAPDTYSGFNSVNDVIDTFIGLNTTRVQLNIVDWLRSIFVDFGTKAGWDSTQISTAENRFTQVFYDEKSGNRLSSLEPFAALIKRTLVDSDNGNSLFPSLSNETLSYDEFTNFIDFLVQLKRTDDCAYLDELKQSGGLPYAFVIIISYRYFIISGKYPGYLTGEAKDHELEVLHSLLRAVYRVLIDGRIGKTSQLAVKLLVPSAQTVEELNSLAKDFANKLSETFIGTPLSSPATSDWLRTSLKKADRKRCQRVFNAILLPNDPQADFMPLNFGTTSNDYQIDHLIPNTRIEALKPGGTEGQQIVNFAPVRQIANNKQSNLKCSEKLQPQHGSFANELKTDPCVHPYIGWLVDNHGTLGMQNDLQEFLEPNAEITIGDQRLSAIIEMIQKVL